MPKRLTQEQKLHKRKQKEEKELEFMIDTLEKKWKNKVNYTCIQCLTIAYKSVVGEYNGYVTCEDLIKSSNNTLRHC
jgi:hypothetical protein